MQNEKTKMKKNISIKNISILSALQVTTFLMFCSGVLDPAEPSPYFPVTIGNTWVYSDPWNEGTYTETITGTKVINYKKYYVFESDRGKTYLRTDKNKQVIEYREDSKKEIIIYKFNVSEETEWNISIPDKPGLYNVLRSKNETRSVPAGTFNDCYVFDLEWGWADYGFSHTLAEGLGKISFSQIGVYGLKTYELIGAIIDGKKNRAG